ncbi:hypothetical protein C8R44DRAFT_851290 [Mycena epipterygia]|nr:hypothetical protein C8R44DRAFT_851290 [Mycena epipterygia]
MSTSDRRKRLSQLDQEIPQLQRQLEQLEQERKEVVASLASLTFPVLTLPMELTSEIFMHCAPSTPRAPSSSDAPLLLARVCSQWRNIAIATPQLWSTFFLFADDPWTQAHESLLNCWLSRSRHDPLSISLCYSEEEETAKEEETTASVKASLEFLVMHSSRCREVHLRLAPSVLQHTTVSIPDGGFPRLEHLTIGCDRSDIDFTDQNVDFFATAPQLRSVEIILDMTAYVLLVYISLPWTQLTSFTGKSFTIQECRLVLAQSPALVHCTFFLSGDDETELIPLPLLSLNSLVLHSDRGGGGYTPPILGALTVPRLQTLSVDYFELCFRSVAELITRSSCALRHFACSGVKRDIESHFFDCLRMMPDLSALELSSCDPVVFEQLGDDLELVPNLRSLSVVVQDFGTFPFPTVLAMLKKRSGALRNFELTATHGGFKPAGFDQLVRDGIQNIRIRDRHSTWTWA